MATFNDVPASLRSNIITDIQLGRVIGGGAHGRILEAKWEADSGLHSKFSNKNIAIKGCNFAINNFH